MKEVNKDYDCDKKNIVREMLVDEIRRRNIRRILTLESEKFIFSKLLPDKEIIVFENDADVITKMEKKCPKNVELFFGNISKFGILKSAVDMIYLDFCSGIYGVETEIIKLRESIKKSKLFAITLCLRVPKSAKEKGFEFKGDYQFDLIRRIQELTEIPLKIIFGKGYRDSVPMVTILFENTMKGGQENEE